MWNLMWMIIMLTEIIGATNAADNGDIAGTILFCFLAYISFKFMKKTKDGEQS